MASRQSRAYQSNKPIILICVFVKISTNQSPRVRSWPWCLHESEIQVQGNQRFFFLAASRLVLAASRLSHRKKKRKTSGTRVEMWKRARRTGSDENKVVEVCITGRANQGYCYQCRRRRTAAESWEEVDENGIFTLNVTTQTDSSVYTRSVEIK